MSGNCLRLAYCLLLATAASLLAGCGASQVVSAFYPTRIVSFGDGLSDVGQHGCTATLSRYTVNDGTINIWVQQLANAYGLTLNPSCASAQSTGYAYGNARVLQTPDAVGNLSTPTIHDQVSQFLARDTFGPNDLVVINGGLSDLIVQTRQIQQGAITQDQYLTNMAQAGCDLGAEVRRLVNSGATHVLVTGTYDASRSPWGTNSTIASLMSLAVVGSNAQSLSNPITCTEATGATAVNIVGFNPALEVSVADLSVNVFYVDSAYYYNLITGTNNSASAYGLRDASTVVCDTIDPGVGIGIGANHVNSHLCSPSTITTGLDYTKYTFADEVYFTPAAQVLFGNYAYGRVRARW